jgi:hypothetical protein
LTNDTLLVVGYGSLLSGYGILAKRRGGRSRLVARDAFPVLIDNARRGLAKPSSHGHYLAMDLEPLDRSRPITARVGRKRSGNIGALGLVFDREWAESIALREEYSPDKFVELVRIADGAGKSIGDFLFDIARRTGYDMLAYRRELCAVLGYTSPGYIFHPMPLDDGRVAIIAVGSGYEGSGDPGVRSRRAECGIERLLTLREALALGQFKIERDGQLGYFVECILGGLRGIFVADLIAGIDLNSDIGSEVARRFKSMAENERERFMAATSFAPQRYIARFGGLADPSIAALLKP